MDLKTLQHSPFFDEVSLSQWDVLFDEWEKDSFLYIVLEGELDIDTSLQSLDKKYKKLWSVKSGGIIGEASLSHSEEKQVRIIARSESKVLKIDGRKDFPNFIKEHPDLGYQILIEIIDMSNKRLLQANKQVTANFEVNNAISKIKDVSNTSIYKLLLIFESILGVDQIMFFEKNVAMDEYFKCKFNSKNKHAITNTIIKFPKWVFSRDIVLESGIELATYIRWVALKLWDNNYGFLVAWKETRSFNENEEKLLQNTASSFVAVIHQKEIMSENENKKHIKSGI